MKNNDKTPAKKISPWKIVWRSIYGTIIAFFIFLILLVAVVPHGLIQVFGVGFYRVGSDSMEPEIRVNDYIIAKRPNVNTLMDGDIIIFETNAQLTGAPITQKIVVIHYFGYIDSEGHVLTYREANKDLPSDDNAKYDVWGTESTPYYVTADNIKGVYTGIIRSADFIDGCQNVFTSPWFYGTGIVLLAAGGTVIYFVSKKKKNKKEKEHH